MTKEELKRLGQKYLEAHKKWTDDFDVLEKNGELEVDESNIHAWRRNQELWEEAKKLREEYWNGLHKWIADGFK